MLEIIPRPKSSGLMRVFECDECLTIFKTNEYRVTLNERFVTMGWEFMTSCPCCGHECYDYDSTRKGGTL